MVMKTFCVSRNKFPFCRHLLPFDLHIYSVGWLHLWIWVSYYYYSIIVIFFIRLMKESVLTKGLVPKIFCCCNRLILIKLWSLWFLCRITISTVDIGWCGGRYFINRVRVDITTFSNSLYGHSVMPNVHVSIEVPNVLTAVNVFFP